ncbi:MAG: hypothetical protein KAV87_35180, partial [Desulfobacteraceae bacterium]|nr:hypothetical protein [Desulfobacteraceae bacterium]
CLKKLKRAYRIVPTGIGTYEGDLGAGIKICMGFWNVMIFILAIVAVPSLVRRQPLIAFSLFSIVTITLIHLPFSASTRKMLPIMPHFFILAAYSIALLIDRLSYVYSKLTKK